MEEVPPSSSEPSSSESLSTNSVVKRFPFLVLLFFLALLTLRSLLCRRKPSRFISRKKVEDVEVGTPTHFLSFPPPNLA